MKSVEERATTGELTNPPDFGTPVKVRNTPAVTGVKETRHPRGTICAEGFVTDDVVVLTHVAARVYNSSDDGGEPAPDLPFPGIGSVTIGKVLPGRKVERTTRFDFRFIREESGEDNEISRPRANPAPSYFDNNWIVVWLEFDNSGEYKERFRKRIRGESSTTTECDK